MEVIDFTLKSGRSNSIRKIAIAISLMHVTIFLLAYLLNSIPSWPSVVVAFCLLFFIFQKKLKVNFTFTKGIIFLILSIIWIIIHIYWMAGLCLTLYLLHWLTNSKIVFHFSPNGISRSSFITKKYGWNEFVNIILKDNILTLDFKNNSIVQSEIEDSSVNPEYFNKFVNENIKYHS